MADLPAPGVFSAELEKWILNKCRGSVFFVMSTAREGETEALTARMNEIDLLPEDERDAELTNHRASTGFVVDDGETGLKILTCAHLLDHVFNAKKRITVADVNKMFVIRVLCDQGRI
jgi:hypothetical protein